MRRKRSTTFKPINVAGLMSDMTWTGNTGRFYWIQHYVTVMIALLALTGIVDVFNGVPDGAAVERTINLHHIWGILGLSVFLIQGRVVVPTPGMA